MEHMLSLSTSCAYMVLLSHVLVLSSFQWIVHLAKNPFIQRLIPHAFQLLRSVNAVVLRSTYDIPCYAHTDLSYGIECRVQQTRGCFIGCQHLRQCGPGRIDHAIGDAGRSRKDCAETDTGEDVPIAQVLVWIAVDWSDGRQLTHILLPCAGW